MSAEERLPGTRPDRPDRIVLHVDNDCFYAACERLREPALVDEPLVIGMGYDDDPPTGAVATASYEAREFGIESAQPISEAVERLPPREWFDGEPDEPTARYRPVDMAYYESIAADVKAILREYADVMREVSIDEAYLDCTDRTDWGEAAAFGKRIKERVRSEIGIPTSVGIAPSMSVAKIASDHDKPDGLVVVSPDEVPSFLAPLPVEDLHGVGPVTAEALREEGWETIGDLAAADPGPLVDQFGERGRELHQRARGRDDRSVTPRGDPKSLSRESSFSEPVDEVEPMRARITELAQAVAARATDRGATYRTIGIKVVTPPYDVNTRERSLPGPVDEPDLVQEVALDLLEEFEGESVRKVGVRVSNLSFETGEQSPLDSWAGEAEAGESDGSAIDSPDRARTLDHHGQTTLRAFGGEDRSIPDGEA